MELERIESKLIAYIAVALAVLGVFSMFFVIYTIKGGMREDFSNKNELVLNNLAKILGPLICEYDFNAVERELDVAFSDEDVHYAVVIDEKGKAIRSRGRDVPIAPKDLLEDATDIIYDNKTVGRLKMSFSSVRINQKIQRLELTIALLLLISFLVLSYLIYFLTKRLIIVPLNELNVGVKHISQGDFDYRIRTERNDQIGELTRAFNRMALDLKLKTERIIASEGKYRTLVEGARDAIVTFDLEGTITSWNQGAEIMLGYEPKEVMGKPVAMLVPDEFKGEQDKLMMHVKEEGFVAYYESVRLAKDGTRIPVEMTVNSMRNESGDIVGLSGILRDITERKRAEEEIRKHREHLEALVGERTIQLEEKSGQLKQANLKLQELDRLKSMFIASMSHELRTPLNSIIGFSSIILNGWIGPLNDEQKENLSTVLRSGKHLLALINDVIDVSKIEAGKIDSYTEDFDLYDVVSEAVAMFTTELKDKKLELKVEPIHQKMHMDRRRLLQCVVNLINNAVKFTEEGTIAVQTRLEEKPEELPAMPWVEISVSDTGIGIKEEDLQKIFLAFHRADSPLKGKVKGTGLGLYLTQKILTGVLKGEITVESKYGKGSTFSIRIPVTPNVITKEGV